MICALEIGEDDHSGKPDAPSGLRVLGDKRCLNRLVTKWLQDVAGIALTWPHGRS